MYLSFIFLIKELLKRNRVIRYITYLKETSEIWKKIDFLVIIKKCY